MKFYYKDKLIRTSKTHNYTHAVLTANEKLLACASSYELAVKAIATNTGSERSNLDYYKTELNALNKGLKQFTTRSRYGCYKHEVKHTKDELNRIIESYENYLKGIKIVELRVEM